MFKITTLTLILVLLAFRQKKHTLSVLLTLEILILLIIISTLYQGIDIFYSLLMICVGACEGAVGLRTIIRVTRRKRAALSC